MTNNTYRILVIDDTASIHEDYRKVLGPSRSNVNALDDIESQLFGGDASEPDSGIRFEIDCALQGQAGVELLKQSRAENRPYAMAFVDMRMPPGWDGVQTIRELWKVDPTLQAVICTAYSDYSPQQIAKELKLDGRMMILRKPFDAMDVLQLATTFCEKWQIGQSRANLERVIEERTAHFKHAALHDPLTGLPNRSLFADRIQQTMLRSKRDPDYKFAVLYIDVDEFKIVNDSLGHEAGDELLLKVTERIATVVRELDTITRVDGPSPAGQQVTARLGGDEFAIILDNLASNADAARVAQRLVEAGGKPYVIKGHNVRCSFSVGVTTSALPYQNGDEMLRDADTAMYHAKRDGRNQFVMFDHAMHLTAKDRLTLEADLRNAVTANELQVHYQPIVELRTDKIVGFEALARWNHPTRGAITPNEFIPIAEETGLIVPLGLQVLETACRQMAQWHQHLPHTIDLTMSVNLSRKQLVSRELVPQISRILKETGLPARNLKLEITESCVMVDAQATIKVLKEIQTLGVQLHIDDFGTGYSSLSCLQMFPLNGLKIDRSFIKDMEDGKDLSTMLKAIVTLAHSMNMPLVSEGVETAAQASMLQGIGCDFGQGFLIARPMPAADMTNFIATQMAKTKAA